MGDMWDYKLKKMEMAWELANRMIPKAPTSGGRWTEDKYLDLSQQTLKKAFEAVNAVFIEDEPTNAKPL